MSREISFTKMVGTGNDFLIVDTLRRPAGALKAQWPAIAQAICDRRHGIGADGLLVLEPSQDADARMRVFNPDGSEAEMCGNGARCVARFLDHALKPRSGQVRIETAGGLLMARVNRDRVAIQMPDPTELQPDLTAHVGARQLQLGFVNTGVPHAVVPVADLDRVDVAHLGRQLRTHRMFQPRGANVDFIEAQRGAANRLRIRTYERGVEGETLACGTGVTAAAVLYALRLGHHRSIARPAAHRIVVEVKSGETLFVSLKVQRHGNTCRVTDVTLDGAVRWICRGTFAWPTGSGSHRSTRTAKVVA